jgi:hypothetical protein
MFKYSAVARDYGRPSHSVGLGIIAGRHTEHNPSSLQPFSDLFRREEREIVLSTGSWIFEYTSSSSSSTSSPETETFSVRSRIVKQVLLSQVIRYVPSHATPNSRETFHKLQQ